MVATAKDTAAALRSRREVLNQELGMIEALLALYANGQPEAAVSAPAPRPRGPRIRTPDLADAHRRGRRVQLLAYVKDHQGCTVKDVADHLRVDATSLYRIVRDCQRAKDLRKDGRQLYTVED